LTQNSILIGDSTEKGVKVDKIVNVDGVKGLVVKVPVLTTELATVLVVIASEKILLNILVIKKKV
jgi:hypothetical protein